MKLLSSDVLIASMSLFIFGLLPLQMASIRYMHYSNGGLNSKNPGMDFLNMAYSYQF